MTASLQASYLQLLALLVAVAIIIGCDLKPWIDAAWIFLRTSSVFQSVYFETWYATGVYTLLMLIPATIDRIPFFDPFKLDPHVHFQHPGYLQVAVESAVYMAPLGLMDTFMVKKYAGVPDEKIRLKRLRWMQRTRLLPDESPTTALLVIHLIVSLLIFDAIFFLYHLSLHKVPLLYRWIHADHHNHVKGLHARVTNKLTIVERVSLILIANFSLKVIGAHPLTRVAYVPIFQWLLIENHSGYDFPWSIDKICPFGLMGGSRYHYDHHVEGVNNYEPFFTYLDQGYRLITGKERPTKRPDKR